MFGDSLPSFSRCNRTRRRFGGVRERPNRRAWKAREAQASVGSNPTPSARSGLTLLTLGTPGDHPGDEITAEVLEAVVVSRGNKECASG